MAGSTNGSIIDASYLLNFLLSDEKIKEVEETFDRLASGELRLYAPWLLTFEVLNGLHVAVSRKRVAVSIAQELAQSFLKMEITILATDPLEVFDLAQKENLTVYDASYLYLSIQRHVPLLSLDKHLQDLT